MKFGPIPVAEAAGAISAHSVRGAGVSIRKGAVLSKADVGRLAELGLDCVVAARLEDGDIGEDEAASRLARALAGPQVRVERPFTGRSNLFASRPGVLAIDRHAIDRINAVDEAVTIATLPAFKPVVEGEMIGTVKIIPYAVAGAVLDRAVAEAANATLDVKPYEIAHAGVVSTILPGLKPSVVAKTIGSFRDRLAPAGAIVVAEAETDHLAEPLAAELTKQVAAGCELIVVFGASAIADRRDVIPSAIEAAGGTVEHFGMPVDPGNLLLVGRIGAVPVIGAPGCARSPKENGFDWILHRLLARVPVSRQDIAGLGVGGLLMEIVSRPQPREGGESRDDE